jgi:prepilin-type N-terminal cleavage/methylation domain-containing protein
MLVSKNKQGGMNNKGFSMLEVLLVLTVVATLIGSIAFAGNGLTNSGNVTQTLSSLGSIQQALTLYRSDNGPSCTGVTMTSLTASGKYLPAGFSGTGSNGFGGDLTISANGTDSTLCDVTMSKVPAVAQAKLDSAMKKQSVNSPTYTAASQTYVVTF